MGRSTQTDRKARILDAAEIAFADFGFTGASLRHIVLEAGVNLATVYYYFGSKEGLMEAVLGRRFGPLREEQLAGLRELGQSGLRLPVEKILEVMLLPPLRLAATAAAKSPVVMRLIGRMVAEPNPQTQTHIRGQYQEVKTQFIEAFRRSLPEIPPIDLLWRIEFIWGALALILCNPANIKEKTGGVCDPLETGKVLAQMINFFSAGIRAPATPLK